MFRVTAASVDEYFAFDAVREADLRAVDAIIRSAAPSLNRWFVGGTPAGEPGMAMSMIGYGQFHYTVKSSTVRVAWPVVGLALQKSYFSVYISAVDITARDGDRPFTTTYPHSIGSVNISPTGALRFARAADVDSHKFSTMIATLDAGLTAGSLVLRHGRSAKTV
ncbi:DUF1801 domain-containing protein [Antrihabitans cavernicola]|uniref:DUF1801 domain-containing protein n=1 Tax=Antrihabitans cavernicola TaxID=2495913 RepID=A0A5A7S6H5_9NOCA|nr:DUF1801 domain-containing protein [Spelaeibacter cavernicola]KAA0021094.1 DUF1801 domain-containing protein [Spelaeibacter cavernicola]